MTTLKDPVCGMEFTEEEAEALGAASLERDGARVWFCCAHCRDEYVRKG